MTGAHKTAGLSLKANKLYTMGTSTENPSILETTEAYAAVLPGDYELQSQGYNQYSQPNAYQGAYINRSPVLYNGDEYPEDHKEANAQFVAENIFEIFSKGFQDCKHTSSSIPSDNTPCLGNKYSTTLVESDKCGLTVKGKPMTFALIPAVLVTLIDREFLSHVATTACIQTSGLVTVNSIASSEMTYEYVRLDLWFKGLLNGKPATTYIQREARVVNNLKAKLLVGMDVLGPEKIDLLFTRQPVKQNVQTVKKVLIEPHTLAKPEYHSATQRLAEGDRAIYAHVIDSQMASVQTRNDSDKLIVLGRHAHLGYIAECLKENCYLVSAEAHSLAEKVSSKIHQSSWVQTVTGDRDLVVGGNKH
ncbi:hypothetical protein LPUS_09668 [Lasallia pustulata]|uniref:Uncharacterized protein n=1 Tax=Lasallia pustulata TaxID=136370 RepID=A0A1W5D7U3_9LECA|nr:hypothetical protein LPUS_09668 [Lasallia pustulata]